MEKTEIVNMFNNRNEKYYNKLKVQNRKYFDSAYKLYKENKNDPKLGQYAKAWVGKDEQYANLTWEYIEYLTTVEHTGFGKGMDRIYDGLVFNKYPWEHLGIGDRKSYRAYDLTMIAKSLFMISLYSAYGGLNDVEKEGLYNSYKGYKPQLKAFCEFKISDPDKFRVCQIKGAHFIMHKELQKYYYYRSDGKAPNPRTQGQEVMYRPEWHEAGSIKIENPKEVKSKLMYDDEAVALYNYYHSAVYPKQERIIWTKMLVGDNDQAGGAVLAKPLKSASNIPVLVVGYADPNEAWRTGLVVARGWLPIEQTMIDYKDIYRYSLGEVNDSYQYERYNFNQEYYIALIEKRY